MSWLTNIIPFAQDSIGEIGKHPWQAAGAALGVPGFDPAIGGLFNNRPGGALLSPTGNFTSSAWQDMRNNNPGDAAALNQFSGINSVADKIAPMIAGGYATGLMGGAGGASSSLGGSSTLGPSGIGGSGSLFGIGSGMGGSTMTGTVAPELASSSPYASAFGGSSMAYPFSMGASTSSMNPQLMQQAMQMLQQRNQQQQQPGAAGAAAAAAYGNPAVRNASIGQPMPYTQFGGAGAQPFGFGGNYGTL
jgi:hypothetical protein